MVLQFLILDISRLSGQDLGIHGHLFTIDEPDLLEVLQSRLRILEEGGHLATLQQQMSAQVQNRLQRPEVVQALPRTMTPRTWFYDPTFKLSGDVWDHQGRVFYTKGTRINPLHYRPFNQILVWFDGDDPLQVAWIEQHYRGEPTAIKLILVKGAPFELAERLGVPVYFDQHARLIHKFGITQVPATLKAHGDHLQLQEWSCEAKAVAQSAAVKSGGVL